MKVDVSDPHSAFTSFPLRGRAGMGAVGFDGALIPDALPLTPSRGEGGLQGLLYGENRLLTSPQPPPGARGSR